MHCIIVFVVCYTRYVTPGMLHLECNSVTLQVSEHGAYMVDSLWETVEVLRDWKSMTELLLSDELGK